MKPVDLKLKALLELDPLAEAERVTGLSYKTDENTSLLGMGIMVRTNAEKAHLLKESGDVYSWDQSWEQYLDTVKAMGFVEVLREPFLGKRGEAEELCFLWRAGLLLFCHSHMTTRVNEANAYFNWRPKVEHSWPPSCSGGLRDGVFIGHKDAREALKFFLEELSSRGTILEKWTDCPFLWLLTYMDDVGEHKSVTAARVAKLPAEIRTAILDGKPQPQEDY